MKNFVLELAVEKPQLPHLIGDVLADVSHGSVRSHDDFFVLFARLPAFVADVHDPAAFVLAFRCEPDGFFFFEELVGALPKMQAKNIALPRQKVVANVDALHRREVVAHDRLGDQLAERSFRGGAFFDCFERVLAKLQTLTILRVEAGDTRI